MINRIEYVIPEAPDEYEAYLYLWHIWIEKLNYWKFYGGRKHDRYHKVDYLHSSEDKQFKNDFARSKRVIFELLKYHRLHTKVYIKDEKIKSSLISVGFKKEGRRANYYAMGDHAILYYLNLVFNG